MVTDVRTTESITGTGRGLVSAEPDRVVVSRRGISWGAVLGAVALALSVQAVLTFLGIGLGASVAGPATRTADPVATLGAGTLIWACITGLISFGIGGFLAGSMSNSRFHVCGGAAHGLLVWAVSGIFAMILTAMSGAAMLGSAAGMAPTIPGMMDPSTNSAGYRGAASPGRMNRSAAWSANSLRAPGDRSQALSSTEDNYMAAAPEDPQTSPGGTSTTPLGQTTPSTSGAGTSDTTPAATTAQPGAGSTSGSATDTADQTRSSMSSSGQPDRTRATDRWSASRRSRTSDSTLGASNDENNLTPDEDGPTAEQVRKYTARAGLFGALALCCGAIGGLVGGGAGRKYRDNNPRLRDEQL